MNALEIWLREFADICGGMKPVGQWPGEGAAAKLREAAAALEAAREALDREAALKGGVEHQRDTLWAELEAAREDAERWRFCAERDAMPVIANDGKTWCMFVAITSNRRSLFTGKTPAEAVDAAIDQARGKGVAE